MSFTVVIPSRYGSSRLPGKPLMDLAGKPMIQRVWEQACLSNAARVIIATDDDRIRNAATAFGAEVVMTAVDHPSGTDRLQEVTAGIALDEEAIVVNVQGDEPLIPPDVINQVAQNLAANPAAAIATLCEPITLAEDLVDPNVVKVVFDNSGNARYFSRAPIPWPRDAFSDGVGQLPERGNWYRHIGLYAYRSGFLNRYVTWPPAPTEVLEQLEQLRALHHGEVIHVESAAQYVPPGVDTEIDLQQMRDLLTKGSR